MPLVGLRFRVYSTVRTRKGICAGKCWVAFKDFFKATVMKLCAICPYPSNLI